MKAPRYTGNYLGIVTQNNDPLQRGRVKIFIPHIGPNIYKGWNDTKADKKFKFIGVNTYSDLTSIVDSLNKVLPWAECASPLVGENSSGLYNASQNAGTISDSNKLSTSIVDKSSSEIVPGRLTQYSQNLDGIGEKPANQFDIDINRLNDAFSDPSVTNCNNVNKLSFSYTPEALSNTAKGAFAVPRVGAHLWVFFEAGDPLKPVYFASSFGKEDWNAIYQNDTLNSTETSVNRSNQLPSLDYPGAFENSKPQSPEGYTNDNESYRNKFVINQKGGTLHFVNSDNREMLKLTHYSGSFKEFNNYANIELATSNNQLLVLGDDFSTVRGSRNEFTQYDYDQIVQGDYYKKIGKFVPNLVQQWKSIVSEIANVKQLFDIQRCSAITRNVLQLTSTLQNKSGTSAPCPVCSSDINSYWVYNNSYNDAFINAVSTGLSDSGGDYIYGPTIANGFAMPAVTYTGVLGQPSFTTPNNGLGNAVDGSAAASGFGTVFGIKCPCCGGTAKSPSSQDGFWINDPIKNNLKNLINSKITQLADLEKQMGLGGSEIIEIAKHKIETIGTAMNDFPSVRVDAQGKCLISEVIVGKYGTFYNRAATPLVEYVHVDDLPGGNSTLNVCNRYNIMVGSGGLSMKSYGPVNITGTITNIAGEQVNIASENEVNIDGGARLSLVGDVVSIRQRNRQQIVIDSNLGVTSNVTVAGGMHVEGELFVNHITAPTEIQSTEPTQVFCAAATDAANMNGKLIGFGVALSNFPTNVGGKYVPSAPSTTGAPYLGFTDPNVIIGYIPAGAVATYNSAYGYSSGPDPVSNSVPIPIYGSGITKPCIKGVDTGTGGVDASQMVIAVYGTGRDADSIMVEPHSHTFRNIPLTLKDTNAGVRTNAEAINSYSPVGCSPIQNVKK